MNIADEIRAANQELLQDQWDKWLIEGWKNYKDQLMHNACSIFCFRNKISEEDFRLLKRTPKHQYHFRCRVSRYFAAYLHSVSEALWNGWADETVLKLMKKTDIEMVPFDASKYKKERAEQQKANKSAMAEQVSHDLVKRQRESNSRSNWKACK